MTECGWQEGQEVRLRRLRLTLLEEKEPKFEQLKCLQRQKYRKIRLIFAAGIQADGCLHAVSKNNITSNDNDEFV
jgi:hypothetical protein